MSLLVHLLSRSLFEESVLTSSEGGPDEMNFVVGSNEKGKKT